MKFKILFVFVSISFFINAQNIRPIKDSIGFCWNAEEMNRFIKFLEKNSSKEKFSSTNLIAAISVHDDYLYAGKIYYPLYKLIKAKEVVIFGVTHGTVRKELGELKNILILDEFDEWKGVYSNVKISELREKIKSNLQKENYIVSNKAHSLEHSIEALIPFLQYYNRDLKITPIMITQMSFEKMNEISNQLTEIICNYIKEKNYKPGQDIFFLISNDANHYGVDFNNSPFGLDLNAHKIATDLDKKIIHQNLNCEINKSTIKNLSNEIIPNESKKIVPLWCGRYPLTFGLITIEKIVSKTISKNIYGKLYKYSDTLTEKVLPFENTSMGLTAIFSPKHWCGWFTLGIYHN
ncbi:MAG: AmmeMemoRadiSam system protein B [Melioribacteraceae bacterium]|nr:AmmeMemoRadiSam system protein B [Melioribacteraceae bacterium]